jgi:hypothetical protein
MQKLTTALELCNQAFFNNDQQRDNRPTESFRMEQQLNSVFLNLMLALFNISSDKPLLVVEMYQA